MRPVQRALAFRARFLFGLAVLVAASAPVARMDGAPRSPIASLAVGSSGVFTFIRSVEVTPDGNLAGGGFVRVFHKSSNDRIVVTFNAALDHPEGGCMDSAHVYKEYTADMQATGNDGILACIGADIGSLLVGNSYYLVNLHREGTVDGWHIWKFDAGSWAQQARVFNALDKATEMQGDQMLAVVGGMIDISSQYNATGIMPDLMTGAATHHRLFTTDLGFVERKVLADTPHICGSSMIEVDGVRYLVSANAFLGDLVVMAYDSDWTFLGVKLLRRQAHWSTGLAWDGQRFYLAYMDTSQRTYPNSLPVSLNVRLAAFDRDWNLIEDIPVTSFTWDDLRQPGRPYLLLDGNRLYVSYDCDTIDPDTHQENQQWQAYVAVYDVAAPPTFTRGRPVRHVDPDCLGGRSPLGVLRSVDHGATWTDLGNACMEGSAVYAVDPTPLLLDGKIALYVIDLDSLGRSVAQSVWVTTSEDGVNFDAPVAAYTQSDMMVDPGIARTQDGTIRLYVPSGSEGIISAVSTDGMTFTREEGVRSDAGGMPGVLVLPDGRVRMFLSGGNDGQNGIFSAISDDGLDFTVESGVRIPATTPTSIVDNPQPIRLNDGGYLMLYSVHDARHENLLPWEHTETHLATSADGFAWTGSATIVGYGGTSCVIETEDGALYIYYVDR